MWGMLYADDAGTVSRSPDGIENMMTVIMTACSAFVLTVSEAKTETRCLHTKGGEYVPFTFNAAGQVYKRSRLCTRAGLSAQIGTSEVSR